MHALQRVKPEHVAFALFVGVYIAIALSHFWVLPYPSDPLQYLAPAVWGSTYGYYPWLDRITLVMGLRIFTFLPVEEQIAGPIYVLFVNCATLLISMIWLHARRGLPAVVIFATFFSASWYFLEFAVQIYPETTLILYALLSFVVFDRIVSRSEESALAGILLGLFTALCLFSKITAFLLPFFYAFCLLKQRKYRTLCWSLAGGLFAVVLVFGLYWLLFDFESLLNTIERFFAKTIAKNITGRESYNNLVNYIEPLFDRRFTPVFLGLLVFVGALKDEVASGPARLAWVFVLGITVIYWLTERGFEAIPNYVFQGYFFALLAFAAYLGRGFATPRPWRAMTLWTSSTLFAMVLGWGFGAFFSPSNAFAPGILDLPHWAGMVLNGLLIVNILAMVMYEHTQRRAIATLLVGAGLLWNSAYGARLAYDRVHTVLAPEGMFVHDYAPVLGLTDTEGFSICIQHWEADSRFAKRMIWVYRVFYDTRFEKRPGYKGQVRHDKLVHKAIKYVGGDCKDVETNNILTDNPELVLDNYASARIIQEIAHKGRTYFLVSIVDDANAQ